MAGLDNGLVHFLLCGWQRGCRKDECTAPGKVSEKERDGVLMGTGEHTCDWLSGVPFPLANESQATPSRGVERLLRGW